MKFNFNELSPDGEEILEDEPFEDETESTEEKEEVEEEKYDLF